MHWVVSEEKKNVHFHQNPSLSVCLLGHLVILLIGSDSKSVVVFWQARLLEDTVCHTDTLTRGGSGHVLVVFLVVLFFLWVHASPVHATWRLCMTSPSCDMNACFLFFLHGSAVVITVWIR